MSDGSSPLLVEFVGVPGAGKTTISRRAVVALAGERRVAQPTYAINEVFGPPRRQLAKVPYVLRGAVASPDFPLRYAGIASARLRPSLLFNWLYATGAAHRAARRDAITVFDQGQVQAFWSFVVSEPGDVVSFARRALLEVLPDAPHLLVFVRASRDVVSSRLGARASTQSRIDPNGPPGRSVDDALEAVERVADVAARLAAARPDVSLVEVRNEDRADLEAGTAAVVDAIREHAEAHAAEVDAR